MPDNKKKKRKLKDSDKGKMANEIVRSLKPGLKPDIKKIKQIKQTYKY